MADLAACYFCGAALDDSLATVRLDDGPSLTLCRSCREKLERVLDAMDGKSVSAATESANADPDPAVPTAADDASDAADDGPSRPTAADPDEAPEPESARGTSASATEDDERDVVAGDQDVSALEYNKVMRMLKNRSFPVDRDEFVAVAANAYQVSYADCDRVIDAAIEQGLLEEADGRLVRPD